MILLAPLGWAKPTWVLDLTRKVLDVGMVVDYTTLSHLIMDLKKTSCRGIWNAGGGSTCAQLC